MSACPACGHDNPDAAKFCSECGRPLVQAAASSREERKVVTVLFADLVGFTTRAERLDPEDVRAMLSPYYARLRRELERFGGTVEKFIGDAVMAVFGAPVAHEDDPERAVRAAIAIRDWVLDEDADLQLRIAVNTGEALVVLGARTAEGEGMVSGDVVNTAARLQSAAPVNGILAGETTYRATAGAIDYRAVDAVTAKGKSDPVRAWEALQARARQGVDLHRSAGPLIGREHELALLSGSLDRVRRERSPLLVTMVGVPGIGKSRLLAELFHAVESEPGEFVLWRQGRSLPYGDGVTHWALSEIVKAQAGILESDSADSSASKLRTAVAQAVADESEAQWIESQLRPLAGLAAGETGGDLQAEAFTAWSRFFEALAEQRPLTLVFEDVQWAGDAMLDFIEHLVEWSTGVPMLVVCTARPELYERRPGWGGGKRNATTLSLSPLSDEDTARLISSISSRPVLAAEAQQALIARSGGNPLYAQQYVLMQAERGGDLEQLPETVQGIIAARIDALAEDEKSLLQNAAVLGKLFWLGGVASIGGVERPAVERHLHALERKEFVQRARRSTVAGDVEYAFLHILVRDVAYGQIPRGMRAEKHRLAAEWLETLGRSEDHAEMLAHHYMSAAELLTAAGRRPEAGFAARVTESLADAGDRAESLHAHDKAATFFEAALQLAAPASVAHATVLLKLGRSRHRADRAAPELLSAARDELLAADDWENAAEAELILAEISWGRGDGHGTFEHLNAALSMVDARPLSRSKAHVLASLSRFSMLNGRPEALDVGRRALAMADELGDDELRANVLNNVGCARVNAGDRGGIEDLERSIAVARQAGAPEELVRGLGNLSATNLQIGRLQEGMQRWVEARDAAARFGQVGYARFFSGQSDYALILGDWDGALAASDAFLGGVGSRPAHYLDPMCYLTRAVIRLGRGDTAGAELDAARGLETSDVALDPQNRAFAVAMGAHVVVETGNIVRAEPLFDEFLAILRTHDGRLGFGTVTLHVIAWTAVALRREHDLTDAIIDLDNPWALASRCFASGDAAAAAEVLGRMGARTEEAYDRLWLARRLAEQGRRSEADRQLRRALAFFREVKATRYTREGEALLAASA